MPLSKESRGERERIVAATRVTSGRARGERSAAIVALLLLPLSACASERAAREAVFEEVWSTVDAHFFDPRFRGVDWRAARERALQGVRAARSREEFALQVNGMLSELGTSHTAYLTPDDGSYYVLLELFWEALAPERRDRLFPGGVPEPCGIGVSVEKKGEAWFVRGVLDGSPAQAAGLLVGDRLVAVEGAPFQALSFGRRSGLRTTVRVRRAADGPELELTVVPDELLPSERYRRALEASARVFEREGRRLGYAHVWSYAGREMHETLGELLLEGPLREADGLVLDLRGGYGGANPEYLNLFRRDLPELKFVDRDGEERTHAVAWTKPVVLLIDEGTTSGKEIFAYGFQRQQRGLVVGARSAGAVVGGSAFLMADGSLLYLAVRDVRVDGQRLEGVGVTPDVEVAFDRPWSAGRDPQLERALEVLASELGSE